MSGSTTSNYSTFRILIKKGTKSGSTQPSPGGNGQQPGTVSAKASASVTVEFTIESMRTLSMPLSQQEQVIHLLNPLVSVNDYTLTAITTEPAPTDVTISGSVDYAQPVEK